MNEPCNILWFVRKLSLTQWSKLHQLQMPPLDWICCYLWACTNPTCIISLDLLLQMFKDAI